MAAVAALAVAGVLTAALFAQAPTAQSPAVPEWQTAAGGKMAFDVASIKPSNGTLHTNVNLSDLDGSPPSGGFLSANFPLSSYISFAYKLSGDQVRLLLPSLPKWATACLTLRRVSRANRPETRCA